MLLIGLVVLAVKAAAEIAPYYSTAQLAYQPVYYSRIYGGFPESPLPQFMATTEKPYNMAEEVDGLVKYYTELAFPSTAQRQQRLKLPSRSPYRLERTPPLHTPSPQPTAQFSLDYLPEKEPEYEGKLPFREADSIPIRASGIPQYVQQPAAASPTAAAAAGMVGPQYLQQQPAAYPTAAAPAPAAPAADVSTTTTAAPTTTTTNGYNALGWKTDDDGNVFVGDDNAKLLLIQAAPKKYWDPLPKDWPEADLFGSMYPDSKLYRGPPAGCPKC